MREGTTLSREIEDRPPSLLQSLDQSALTLVSKNVASNRRVTAQNTLEILGPSGHAILQLETAVLLSCHIWR
jgi:hypothetical protein